ncbi:MAG: DUF4440 domain-containing protein [Pseudomonadota bacterium]
MSDLHDILLSAERALADPARRGSRDAVSPLLADDFTEVGASGAIYSREDAIAAMAAGTSKTAPSLVDFSVRMIADDVALATYREGGAGVVRASIWRKEGDRWRLCFHQATPSAAAD